ncbi:hypothetical protein ABZ079_34945 [Streptomyces sp. NPDC006314]|uniref:hypothetical protein n=1 Tax=Streptomyces sp. NPDC006314 TaxID=3154475 RepID=UPI0033B9AFBA
MATGPEHANQKRRVALVCSRASARRAGPGHGAEGLPVPAAAMERSRVSWLP